jgi:hypothetical protein
MRRFWGPKQQQADSTLVMCRNVSMHFVTVDNNKQVGGNASGSVHL